MNRLFEEFVIKALRAKLGLSAAALTAEKKIFLDKDKSVTMYPDISWWDDGGACVFVGDAKYKKIDDGSAPNADLYQMLAYATALDLPGGLLIYAQGVAAPATYAVKGAGKRLEVAAPDLTGALKDVLDRVGDIAARVCSLRRC